MGHLDKKEKARRGSEDIEVKKTSLPPFLIHEERRSSVWETQKKKKMAGRDVSYIYVCMYEGARAAWKQSEIEFNSLIAIQHVKRIGVEEG